MTNLNFDATAVKPAGITADDIQDQPLSTGRKWSRFQIAVFDFVSTSSGNAIIVAVAGSGKSTTIVEAMKLARGLTIFLAFNKAIAEELKARGVNARTFHSLVFSPVMRFYNQQQPSMDKLHKLTMENWTFEERKLYGAFAKRLVGLARGMGIGIEGMLPDTPEEFIALAAHHDIEPESDNADFGTAIEYTRALFDLCVQDQRVDFDDMLYRAVRDSIRLPQFDVAFVDEAQDTNPIQRAILHKILKPGGRLIAVGDPAQAIYGFRGADSDALGLLAKEFNCTELPLSITYRCPQAVVNYARAWVSHIEAREGAPEGVVKDLGVAWNPTDFLPGDLVVCRKTAPLITAALRFIRAGIPVQVLGKDIGEGLKALIKKMSAGNVDQLAEKLEEYRQREVEKAQKEEDEAKVEAINDKVGVLLFMCEELLEDRRTIADLEAGIDYLFKDKAKAVTLCTIHKSKGLEAPRVFWLERSECPARWARKDHQRQQELNLCYVATTRAMDELYFIELETEEQKDTKAAHRIAAAIARKDNRPVTRADFEYAIGVIEEERQR
jgi:DNA helicase II / ATP-dependent DNA helicase PcrA